MLDILKGEGVVFSEVFIDRTFPEEMALTRKPGTAMLVKYLAKGIDLDASFVIGDRLTDVQLAKNLGCKAIYFNTETTKDAELSTTDWNDIYKYLKQMQRIAIVERKTSETDIRVELNLDGSGKSSIDTGIGSSTICLIRLPVTETSIFQ